MCSITFTLGVRAFQRRSFSIARRCWQAGPTACEGAGAQHQAKLRALLALLLKHREWQRQKALASTHNNPLRATPAQAPPAALPDQHGVPECVMLRRRLLQGQPPKPVQSKEVKALKAKAKAKSKPKSRASGAAKAAKREPAKALKARANLHAPTPALPQQLRQNASLGRRRRPTEKRRSRRHPPPTTH